MKDTLERIKDYYERALKAIKKQDFKEATKILYKEMSMKLYDISVNIEYLKLEKSLSALPEWSAIMGFQFENLILNNRSLIYQVLNIFPEDIVNENLEPDQFSDIF